MRATVGPFAFVPETVPMMPVPLWKRLLDVAIAGPALLLAAPLLCAIAILIRLGTPGPAMLRQVRIGRGERPFTMLKLRTMRIDADHSSQMAANLRELAGARDMVTGGLFKPTSDPRVTPFGRVLRRFSFDELPQLINVLKGEMSLVGPRPSLPFEVARYTPEQRRRHACLPGLTGLWQVSGRSRLSMPEMLALDAVYVDRQSLWLDLKILVRTPWAVIRGDEAA